MIQSSWSTFLELLKTPFQDPQLVWGIVPLYFGLLLSELTPAKANYRTAIQTGFSFLWAGAQWIYHYHRTNAAGFHLVNKFVTGLVLLLGAVALFSGLRRRFPKYCSFLGYTRFSNYFMITIFPIQAQRLHWTWRYVLAIALFAVPTWLVLHFGFMPFRGGKATSKKPSKAKR
jgi:hypothetical protein